MRASDFEQKALKVERARIAGLDCLRAISIGLVLICHSAGLGTTTDSIVAKGKFGVEVFSASRAASGTLRRSS
jgi:peptidoglycan/LPS O-acetylase OafA/YrhL